MRVGCIVSSAGEVRAEGAPNERQDDRRAFGLAGI